MAATELPTPVVGLVGSAGALVAISAVLGALPAGFPAAVLVLIHQTPDRTSQLPELLARRCALPVAVATDGAMLVAGQVLVAPNGRHLLVAADGRAALIESGDFPPHRPSADLLLTTLAISHGPRAIAVVLSGHGHDGATGATAVHAFGGTVIASDEATSEVPAMPSATIDRGHVIDHVTPLDDIAALLERLVADAR